MAKKKRTETESNAPQATEAPAKLTQEQNELVTFVANNILNSVTLNQTVTLLQQVALRDANTIVTQADDQKLQELKQALEASKQPAVAEAASDKSK